MGFGYSRALLLHWLAVVGILAEVESVNDLNCFKNLVLPHRRSSSPVCECVCVLACVREYLFYAESILFSLSPLPFIALYSILPPTPTTRTDDVFFCFCAKLHQWWMESCLELIKLVYIRIQLGTTIAACGRLSFARCESTSCELSRQSIGCDRREMNFGWEGSKCTISYCYYSYYYRFDLLGFLLLCTHCGRVWNRSVRVHTCEYRAWTLSNRVVCDIHLSTVTEQFENNKMNARAGEGKKYDEFSNWKKMRAYEMSHW